ncbi:MAG: polyprenyl synthetase family protein [Candidatus Omnitrophica bacterium]|nr:polyprenyl synthetase family protein [Candidatus Omnitrophota bacterium]
MQNKIKNKIEKELAGLIRQSDKAYSLSKISPLLFKGIKDFVLRKGKRLRPILFVAGYLGFAKGAAPGLYKTAVSFELLHDFLLVHDDIVDKARARRGKPTLHKMFDNYLEKFKNAKFDGQDLAIVAGDVIYALAVDSFLSIKADAQRKERALKKFIESALYTGAGEFIELLSGIKDIEQLSEQDIYRIYDYKTAHYTFASPLSCGAMLGGANQSQVRRLYRYGIYSGRAFQLKDDILGMFGGEKKTGKPALTDLQEAKKTLLLRYAYNNSNKENKLTIKRILSKHKVNKADLLKMRKIISASGALDYTEKEISRLSGKAQGAIKSSRMRPKYKSFLRGYCEELLRL